MNAIEDFLDWLDSYMNFEKQPQKNIFWLDTIDYLCTDGHHAYEKVANHPLFKYNIKHHIISKSETCLVES